jgi:NAD(P)-dependent dehydrogenase (short-subunit alcohol dehydrogenase family)
MQGKTVLVTGDTGGLGYETARALGRRGARVIITGRNRTRGEDAAMAIERESGSVASTSSGGKRPTATRRPSR